MSDAHDPEHGPRIHQVPDGDDRPRLTCPDCGYVAYENPRIVVGSVPRASDGRLLLCRRAIPPRTGYWTLPAGYLELEESAEAGALREAWEEARADLELGPLLAVYSITRIHQVQLIYRARLRDDAVSAGPESQEVALFRWDEIPWDELAFPTVQWALEHERRAAAGDHAGAFTNPEPEIPLERW
ncbi:NUDIX hydrolase [Spiribacter halobius]|uniref:NUDIX hydrolase n=1 Tax=Sediminicurvatus halobius TaxID=2182432 RepID=A0A2U2N0A7_9GAMM|nr:NUDIX hydrolase [Spiribacter halobius]PWG62560.1 NUDIX hydrolase [Spiribacter halobius]UEX78526.1 NUDIX hydrolase [Spiribacter halobius]